MGAKPTAAQQKVIDELQRCCCVVSIPGSGKTSVITKKVANLLRSKSSARVTAVTFSNAAALELKTRCAKELGSDVHLAERLTTGTFHSLVLRAIKAKGHEAGKRKLANKGETVSIFDRAYQMATGREVPEQYEVEWLEEGRLSLDGHADGEAQRCIDKYHELMKRTGLVDFGELILIGLAMADDGDLYLGRPGDTCLVDEAQDVDEAQLGIVMGHQRCGVIVDMVGDDDQSIFAFRRSLGLTGMNRFKEASDARLIHLDTNFRCRSEILEIAGTVVETNSDRIKKTLTAARADGGSVRLIEGSDSYAEEAWIVERIQEERARAGEGTVCVIARVNRLLRRYEEVLLANEIPCSWKGAGSLMDETLACAMLAVLGDIETMNLTMGIGLLLGWMEITGSEVDSTLQYLEGRVRPGLQEIVATEGRAEGLELSEWSRMRVICASETLLWWGEEAQKARTDAERSGVANAVAEWCSGYASGSYWETPNKRRGYEVASAEGTARSTANLVCSGKGRLSGRVERLRRMGKAKAGSGEWCVSLMTMHGAKGLEFDSVFVIGCAQDIIPGKEPEPPELEEERRLLYVALTRAKDRLAVTAARKYYSNDQSWRAKQTQFTSLIDARRFDLEMVSDGELSYAELDQRKNARKRADVCG